MNANEYQDFCLSVRKLKKPEDALQVAILGLLGEAGEIAECFKKNLTYETADGKPKYSNADIAKELGDVLWYAAVLAHELGYSFQEIMDMNRSKLEARLAQGTLVKDRKD